MADHFGPSISGFADWLPYSGKRKSPATIDQYVRSARRLAAWARGQGRQGFDELTKADLRSFLGSLASRRGGPATQAWKAVTWHGVRSLYRYLAEEEDVADITASITVSQPPQTGRITHLDAHQVGALLKACRGPKELAVISVALDTGMRIAELASLQVSDVLVDDLSARRIIVRGKGDKVRGVVIGSATALALRKYLRQRAKSRYAGLPGLWIGQRGVLTASGLDKAIRDIGASAGLELHPHLLRHTFCHHYRLAGGSVDNLAVLCGWSGVAMSLRYGASAQAERAEAEARQISLVDRAGGRS
jgi:integrase/recombinase XerC